MALSHGDLSCNLPWHGSPIARCARQSLQEARHVGRVGVPPAADPAAEKRVAIFIEAVGKIDVDASLATSTALKAHRERLRNQPKKKKSSGGSAPLNTSVVKGAVGKGGVGGLLRRKKNKIAAMASEAAGDVMEAVGDAAELAGDVASGTAAVAAGATLGMEIERDDKPDKPVEMEVGDDLGAKKGGGTDDLVSQMPIESYIDVRARAITAAMSSPT